MASKIIYTICTNCGCEVSRKGLKVCPKCGEYLVYPETIQEEPKEAVQQQSVKLPSPAENETIPALKTESRHSSVDDAGPVNKPQFAPEKENRTTDTPRSQVSENSISNETEQEEPDYDDIDFSEDEIHIDNSYSQDDETSFDDESEDDDWDDSDDEWDEDSEDAESYSDEDYEENNDFDESVDEDEDPYEDDAQEYSEEDDEDIDEESEYDESEDDFENEDNYEDEDNEGYDENEFSDEDNEEDADSDDEEYEEEPSPAPKNLQKKSSHKNALYDAVAGNNKNNGTNKTRQTQRKQKNLDDAAFGRPHKNSAQDNPQQSKKVYDPNHDGYYDDVLPLINDAIYKIPKDIIIKGIFMLIAVLASIIYLIYNV